MIDLWTTLIPLVVGSAVLPIQVTITLLMLRADGGRRRAAAWVSGMTAVRLAQGLLFGLLLGGAAAEAGDDAGPGLVASTLLLVVGVVFLVAAARKLLDQPDEDAPPPRWLAMVEALSPLRALLAGGAAVALSAKLWVFTLAAIGAIEETELGLPAAAVTYLVFVVAAASLHLAAIGIAVAAPARAGAALDGASALLERHGRVVTIGLGLVFGTWFVVRALAGFGLL